ncbi:hypothetical protein Vretimale_661 [Volvox reticuliferus]|uniref:Uncharacterized protein n=1 Tax=Volvox reticuliferus TaxID=1737510 RepID=A0A8J4BYS8_9CHLO|nr:hypothetical protein Vretifemale_2340 [Volvox reticuliferus]GIL94463.1 hypothetical protein Vretimale_661 [Volvox reticuliferus]
MSIFASNGPVVTSAWSFSSCLSDSEAETFESTVPEGVFSDEDYGVALVIDAGGLAQRGLMAGYSTTDAALHAINAIVDSAGMRPAQLRPADRRGSVANCKTIRLNDSSTGSSRIDNHMLFFSGSPEALHLAMSKLRLAAWLRHQPGLPDIGRFYSVYPQSVSTAKYVPQDNVFNEV